MKKILLLLFACMFISMNMQGQETVHVTGVKFDFEKDTMTIKPDSSVVLTAIVSPSDATNKVLVWEVLNPAAADTISIVNDTICNIITKEVGKTTIIATSNNGHADTIVINVEIPLESIVLSDDNIDMFLGRDTILTATVSPSDATNSVVAWRTSDPSIVDLNLVSNYTVSIKALKAGETKVYAYALEVDSIIDSCVITVNYVTIDSLVIVPDSMTLYVGGKSSLIASLYPLSGGTNDFINWTSDNPSVVKIATPSNDTICYIEAMSVGEAKIIAESYDGKKDTCVITVKSVPPVPIDSMFLSRDTLVLKFDSTFSLMATVLPYNASDKSVTWETNENSVVNFAVLNDTICNIKALAEGSATIFAQVQTPDGVLKDSCFVTVIIPVSSIELRAERIAKDLVSDSVGSITAKINPDYVTDSSLIWVNMDASLVRIDSIVGDTICYFTALRSGVDTIYAMTVDGEIRSEFCFIDIDIRLADTVIINKGNLVIANDGAITLNVKDSIELLAAIYPANVTNDTIRLESSDPEILRIDTISDKIFIRALKDGDAVIRAIAADSSNKKDTCIVRISRVPVQGISLNKDTVILYEQGLGTVIASISPYNVTNDSLVWISSSASVVIDASTGFDSVCTFRGLAVDTAFIYAVSKEDNSIKDSCVVIVGEQYLFVESDTVSASLNGKISFSLLMSDNDRLTRGYFKLELPNGFELTRGEEGRLYRTELTDAFKELSVLEIVRQDDGSYLFDITLTTPRSMLRSGTKDTVKVMDIAYTISNNSSISSTEIYDAKFRNVEFNLNDDVSIKKDLIIVKIRSFEDPTSNEIVDGDNMPVYMSDNSLYVNTVQAETIYVYSLTGSLIYMGNKTEGPAVFNVNTQEKVLIVKGSSGWASKVANK